MTSCDRSLCTLPESAFVRVSRRWTGWFGFGKHWSFWAHTYTMNHLISSSDLNRIETQLLLRRDELVQTTSWLFNVGLLVAVLGTFGYFLYVQYTSHQVEVEETKRIPFTPVTWYSATRNVRSEEYGSQLQPLDSEIGYGLQGLPPRGGTGALL